MVSCIPDVPGWTESKLVRMTMTDGSCVSKTDSGVVVAVVVVRLAAVWWYGGSSGETGSGVVAVVVVRLVAHRSK